MKLHYGALVFLFEPFDHLGLLGIAALLGVYAGIYVFLRGFRMLQHKRLVLNTPLSKIRSASMGLVEVSGMPKGPQIIRAGITGEPCYYYRARAWVRSDSGNRVGWQQVADETVGVPFFVDDGTGQMLVYPQGARLDVHRNFTEEYGGSFFARGDLVPESVRKFLLRYAISATGPVRLEERCILPGYPLFVFGTLGENQDKNPWPSAPHADVIPSSSDAHGNPIQSQPRSVALSSAPLITPATTRNVSMAGIRVSVSSSVVSMQIPRVPAETGTPHSTAANRHANSPSDRSAQEGDAEEFDLHPRAAITKGERNQLFTISSQSQREVAFSLEWEAIACIWGGPALALLSIYVLIVSWAWS